ncbi:hypothetical protein CYMTET_8807 [Cymbomonas tetramitiformis]|uniref:Uncharacterized protein n=1 Tax=Cymbomonas tetramitiformis TaxID=36881 RepID=A0AAE0GSW1_9CHLO|nr:hypothetical protein CYMTET_8807 [Cymbomonas tetramitiformis]
MDGSPVWRLYIFKAGKLQSRTTAVPETRAATMIRFAICDHSRSVLSTTSRAVSKDAPSTTGSLASAVVPSRCKRDYNTTLALRTARSPSKPESLKGAGFRPRTVETQAQEEGGERLQIQLEAVLDEEKMTALFAWVSRAFAGDGRYGDLMPAFAAVFGNLPSDHYISELLVEALAVLPPEELPAGEPYSTYEREQHSLGAMGAGQWTGQFITRPHALLDVRDFTSVQDWSKGLNRGARRTLKKASDQNFTVTVRPIKGGEPAPHSSLAHFRAVVSHEVRLLAATPEDFFGALQQGIGRYLGTTRMAGEIREYRNAEGRVIAFAHEVRKGRVIRGQWFYADDEAARSYVWFHATQELVRRAIEAEDVDVVDLGPSGSDDFTTLKGRYGFKNVEDWPAQADYLGPFWYAEKSQMEDGAGWLNRFLGVRE